MTAHSLPRPMPISLQRLFAQRLLDRLIERASAWQSRVRARWIAHTEYRRAVRAERELARLDPRTLQDIGAAQGLVGQRRWQEEHEAAQFARLLHQRGY